MSKGARLFPLLVLIVLALLVGIPLLTVVFISLKTGLPGQPGGLTLANFRSVFLAPGTHIVLWNTIVFATGTMVVTLSIAIPMVWLLNKTDLPLKGFFYLLMIVSVLIPTFLRAIGWILLTSPRIGLPALLGIEELNFSLYNLPGMWFVQGISFVPASVFMLSAAYRAMDPALEEAAYTSGVGKLMTFWRILVPLTWPATAAVFVYYFITAMSVFEAPAILGLPNGIFVLSSAIFEAVEARDGLPKYGEAGALGMFIIAVGFLASLFYVRIIKQTQKYAVVTGRGYKPRLVQLGRWKPFALGFVVLYFCAELLLPFLIFFWASLLPYLRVPSWEALNTLTLVNYANIFDYGGTEPFANTLILIAVAPLLTIALSIPVSWIVVRSRFAYRGTLDTLVFLSQAIPNIVLAVTLLYLFLITRSTLPIYGTIVTLILANVINSLAYATRTINSSMIQIHRELEEAARVSGVSGFVTVIKITMPLVAGAVFNGWLWVVLLTYREVTMALVLGSPDNRVVSTVIWALWSEGRVPQVSALGVVMMATFFILVLLLRRVFGGFYADRLA
ncbi:MAG: iron ABC transporter permease [Deltaproteobacteria bacterium]|nr:iron ABC transporter permease [Deltaproteobacteria bacterium]MDZ4343670.1 iron ABC transporter permease [Candidatus Binatia bacterium]